MAGSVVLKHGRGERRECSSEVSHVAVLNDASGKKVAEIVPLDVAAKRLGICESLLRRMCSRGRIGVPFGRRGHLITRDELERFAAIPRPVGNPGWKAADSRVLRKAGKAAKVNEAKAKKSHANESAGGRMKHMDR